MCLDDLRDAKNVTNKEIVPFAKLKADKAVPVGGPGVLAQSEPQAQPKAHCATAFGVELEPVHSVEDLLVVGVNTMRAWSAAGADLALGGHIHLPYTLALPGLAPPMWVVQAGTAVSLRTRPGVPNSVNMLRWGEALGCCRIKQWDFAPLDRVFIRKAITAVQPDRPDR